MLPPLARARSRFQDECRQLVSAWTPDGSIAWIRTTTSDDVIVQEGALYPALHRLERQALIEAEWGLSENNRTAKFYRLSRMGRRRLQTGTSHWYDFMEVTSRALKSSAPVPA